MSIIVPGKKSVLDLQVDGSIGEFWVKGKDGNASIQVKYIQTHLGIDVTGTHEERLLKNLRPVREIFDQNELAFDEIMQRDIDDARISSELLKYLLDQSDSGLVKLFPPIIVVALPSHNRRPQKYYPSISHESFAPDKKEEEGSYEWNITRSGEIGQETFEFKQMSISGELLPHTYASLSLNTSNSDLVIVDGQHRAMALLAIYRNLTGWPDKAKSYERYYKRWTEAELNKVDLSGVKLPVMICVFPELDDNCDRPVNVIEACRTIFLALNKNARPVTRSRNYLLNDQDLIAHFIRAVLSKVKSVDANSEETLRLWDIELDATENRVAISADMAISGVMHLYALVELLMLNSKEVTGVTHPRMHLSTVRDLKDCIRRLDVRDELGADVLTSIKRNAFSKDAVKVLISHFMERYGDIIVKGLVNFAPYRAHNDASLELEVKLRDSAAPHAILFEGQGIAKVFDSYIENLEEELGEYERKPAELQAILKDFKATRDHVAEKVTEFKSERIKKLVMHGKDVKDIYSYSINRIYDQTFTTSAFQSALFVTFFSVIEKLSFSDPSAKVLGKERVGELFSEYFR